ncbi:activating signal cointegrator 1 complex subunit 3-like [Centruroides sculpturatus]|uniref:activating signal cointegrator 1 complex subunit 3-like n=1 Tax=Centruroides sculpturatus TaxID=218467 RepID=UPI000C6D0C70|nr:activating signal cointegrator 1 complex subunit 3-like [Centruroides sculpturatus]
MKAKEQLPRFTNTIRAFSDVAAAHNLHETEDLILLMRKRKMKAERSAKSSYPQWKNIKTTFEDVTLVSKDEVKTALRELLKLATEIAGAESSQEMIEGTAAYLFEMFHNCEVLSERQAFQLKKIFGSFPSSVASKVSRLVSKMFSWLSDETQQKLFHKDVNDINKLMDKEFGHKIAFVGLQPLCDNDIILKIDENENFKKQSDLNFSLEYLKECEKRKKDETTEAADYSKLNDNKRCDFSWLERTVGQAYGNSQNNPLGSVKDIVQTLMTLLNSSRSDDELQNDLFDYLGYENISLIEVILQKRKEITNSRAFDSIEVPLSYQTIDHRPNYGCQVTVQSEEEKMIKKLIRKEERKIQRDEAKTSKDSVDNFLFDPAALRKQREAELLKSVQVPLYKKVVPIQREKFPYVFDIYSESKLTSAFISGNKLILPVGHKQINNSKYQEVIIPVSDPPPADIGSTLISVETLDEVGQLGFKGMKTLNRIQSVVFNTAYNTNENLLICAPTGAGKTNIAMLTVLHELKQHMENRVLKHNNFKIVYIAPMKALASEMTRNFSRRLDVFNVIVRELTGDMQLTKKEINQTQMIVTTPEKWDVVTRKATGDIALAQLVRLIIIDEVHLLHGDRGPVLEAIVARTLRQVITLKMIVTTPEKWDVVTRKATGDIALAQLVRLIIIDEVHLLHGDRGPVLEAIVARTLRQVMVFVHARNATVRTAMVLKDIAQQKNQLYLFQAEQNVQYFAADKQLSKSRNKQLYELFHYGFSIHHAGMLRTDRNLVEKFFHDGLIKVLVCTSTLAWGVNLPAHTVIIRGTEIYDSKHGQFVDLDILDVMQIFGRAGRPQFDKYGEGTIITSYDKLNHYLSLLTSQLPIESKFNENLANNLNAEIALGTVSNIQEGVEWLIYTYFYIRMRRNPQVYGLKYGAEKTDPYLHNHLTELIEKCAMELDKTRMIRFDRISGCLSSTDMGRTASHFYIKYDTIMLFNECLKPAMTEEEVLALISEAHEFDQLKVRDDELGELDKLEYNGCWCKVRGGSENTHGKVNILLQSYISRARLEGFSLISDQAYVVQNATRIIRALFEIVLRKNFAIMSGRLLQISKSIEKQLWGFMSPLHQFTDISYELLEKIDKKHLTIDKIKEMTHQEVGHMIQHVKMGMTIKQYAESIPSVMVEAEIQPITRTVIRVKIEIVPDFRWNDRLHGSTEPFWLWIEDPDHDYIYHSEYFLLSKKQVIRKETQLLVCTIPITEPLPTQYMIHITSDRWIGSEYTFPISFKHLILPDDHPPLTELLDLQPLPVSALDDIYFESVYKFTHFNPVQTQIFHTLYHTDVNVLLGAPTGSGKTIAAEIAMFRLFQNYPGTKTVYIAPLKALVRERIKDWQIRFERQLGRRCEDRGPVLEVIVSRTNFISAHTERKIRIIGLSTALANAGDLGEWLGIKQFNYLTGEDRGPVLEVIVSRTNFISAHTERKIRIIGLSTALANAGDLGEWLGIKQLGLYNFRPSVRPVPLEVHISGYPGKHYCPRMALMNKPTYQAICQHSPTKPVLIFVSSRRQTRLTALDLIAFLAADNNPRQWINIAEDEMDNVLQNVRDQNLKLTLSFGIGLHHAGLHERDRNITEELFVNQKIQVLIATATLAWGVNFPAHLVIVKGTEYFDGKIQRYVDFPITDVLQMIGRAGRPQFDEHGVAVVLVQDIKKAFYKKFLYEPFPVESNLLKVLPDHLNAEIVAGTVTTKQECIDYITWTYFFRRLLKNPTFYNLESTEHNSINRYLSGLVDRSLRELEIASCVEIGEDNREITSTVLGRISSYYYLSYKTVQMFQENMKNGMSMEQLLKILTDSEEYDELPVRHNEDALNSDLASNCPLEVDKYTFDSPHTKAHLLFQAHFGRLQLPCSDYLTDLKSVLDQAIRILQSMIDISSDQGWLPTSLQTMILLQMTLQGRWHNDSTLLTLPHINSTNLYCFGKIYPNTITGHHEVSSVECLPELIAYVRGEYETLACILRKELEENQIEQIYDTLMKLPVINVSLALKGFCEDSEKERKLFMGQVAGTRSESQWIEVQVDKEYVLMVKLERENRRKKGETKALAPKFPKQKEEGWFLILGDVEKRDLIAMKRIGYVGTQSRHQLVFYTPEKAGRYVYTLFLMSDCYLGLDQQYEVCLKATEPPGALPFRIGYSE